MTNESHRLFNEKHRRIRRLKRWLRFLPRRANVHRYPILSWFAKAARKRNYLWSFRPDQAVPALHAGFILALLPIYGLQIPIAVMLAFFLRANLPILAGLQLITNPFTVLPIWLALYQIGRVTLGLFAIDTNHTGKEQIDALLHSFFSGRWSENLDTILLVFSTTALGGLIIGIFLGTLSSTLYRFIAIRTTNSYQRIIKKIEQQRDPKSEDAELKNDM
ncbi:MAG: Uncharacterised protein [Opitutia bacterium UBA7350]|nr:MAG: Uncharacterised protein [Opitutae bacterium UBA7350]